MSGARRGDWMQTIGGRKFWPIDPDPADVDIHDIAHALSMMCRFNGHCLRFYSVAEHSVLVSRVVAPEHALWGLLHDAAEAYVADIVRPAKRFISGYREVEDAILSAIAERFGLPPEMPDDVKRADNAVLAAEAAQIMGPHPAAWTLPDTAADVVVRGIDTQLARTEFLARFEEIGGSRA